MSRSGRHHRETFVFWGGLQPMLQPYQPPLFYYALDRDAHVSMIIFRKFPWAVALRRLSTNPNPRSKTRGFASATMLLYFAFVLRECVQRNLRCDLPLCGVRGRTLSGAIH